jgi:sterol desaturase/sphingolipid hydroxylase (fatty acid hydroxylase superfamily)
MQNIQNILTYYVPFIFLILIAIEAFLIWQSGRKYSWRENAASFWIYIIQIAINRLVIKAFQLAILTLAWNYRLFTIPIDHIWGVLLLFVGLEFFYYWQHRASHRIRWSWATHAVHHSVQYYNLSAAYRLGWTGLLSGNIFFFMPLCWLGFPPPSVVMGLSLNLIYQFWIHTELVPKLGILELVLNTPSNHRVHHAANSQYIDKNYGGVTIIFDRLFGTYESEQQSNPPVYGLTKPINSHNPIVVAFHEWGRMFQDLRATQNWRQFLQCIFYSPDWYEKSIALPRSAEGFGRRPIAK